jgi:transcriptional regulator with XRE-family HTH domain
MAQRSQAAIAFGRAVRHRREELGWTQEDLPGIHRAQVGSIERAEKEPLIGSVYRFAAALQIAPWELVRRGDELLEQEQRQTAADQDEQDRPEG